MIFFFFFSKKIFLCVDTILHGAYCRDVATYPIGYNEYAYVVVHLVKELISTAICGIHVCMTEVLCAAGLFINVFS